MPIWICGKPKRKAKRAVVFIDYDNFAITNDFGRPWVPTPGSANPELLLRMAQRFGSRIGKQVVIHLFVNMYTGARSSKLEHACSKMGVFVTHCPRDEGDTADFWLQHAMRQWEPLYRADTPLAIISADKDFAPVVSQMTERGRRVFIGVPTNAFRPRHTWSNDRVCTGSAWVDERVQDYRSMYFLLRPREFTRSQRRYIFGREGYQVEFRRFSTYRSAIYALADVALDNPHLVIPGNPDDLSHLLNWVTATWETSQHTRFGRAEARTIVPYLLAYRFVRFDEDRNGFRVSHAHQQVQFVKSRRDGPRPRLKLLQAEAS